MLPYLLLGLIVRHGKAVPDLHLPVPDCAQQRADHALLPFVPPRIVVDDGEEDDRVDLDIEGQGLVVEDQRLRGDGHGCVRTYVRASFCKQRGWNGM